VSDLGWCLHREGRRDEARRMLDEARVVLETAGDPVLLARCLDRLALSTAWHDPDEALVIADRALTTARCTGDESLEAVVLLHRGEILSMAGRTHDGLVDLDAASQRFVLARDRYMQSVVLWVRAVVLERHGDPAGALEARAAELELLREVGNFRHLAESHQHRARLLTALGRSDDAAQEHALALDAARTSGDETVLARIEADAREPVVTGTVRER
jgi:tetratricopeptide (TPR) repeat protein